MSSAKQTCIVVVSKQYPHPHVQLSLTEQYRMNDQVIQSYGIKIRLVIKPPHWDMFDTNNNTTTKTFIYSNHLQSNDPWVYRVQNIKNRI